MRILQNVELLFLKRQSCCTYNL